MTAAEIKSEFLALRGDERAELISTLVHEAPGADPNDRNANSVEEADSRRAEWNSGQVEGVSKEGFLEELRKHRNL